MGLKDFLAKRNFERRVTRKSKVLYGSRKKRRGPDPIEVTLRKASQNVQKLGWRAYVITQRRKHIGKQYLKQKAKQILGDARSLIGTEARSLLREPKRRR